MYVCNWNNISNYKYRHVCNNCGAVLLWMAMTIVAHVDNEQVSMY